MTGIIQSSYYVTT